MLDPHQQAILDRARDRRFWEKLCPDLNVERPPAARAPSPAMRDVDAASLVHRLRHEGYLDLPGALPAEFVARLLGGVAALRASRVPPIFLFVYDEPWQVAELLRPMLEPVLGGSFVMLPGIWTWWIEPSNRAAGWPPHRDCLFDTVRADGTPRSLSIWLALTDATPDNGCMYVVPAHLDGDYGARRFERVEPNARDARALPAAAGTLLAWTQGVVHWGGRSTERAAGPRVSIGLEFQERATAPIDLPVVDPARPPDLERRLALIGKNIYHYWRRAQLPEGFLPIAVHLGQSLSSPR